MYLLDTNVWITVLRQPTSTLAARFQAISPNDIRICSIVIAELLHGCLRSAKPAANRSIVHALLTPYTSLSFDDAAAGRFAMIRHTLEQAGQMIGPYDAQIAAIALTHGCTLVTHNVAEFGRIPGLVIEDWQVP
jgi:tRNA(fMet)-specific endonuclease VapC